MKQMKCLICKQPQWHEWLKNTLIAHPNDLFSSLNELYECKHPLVLEHTVALRTRVSDLWQLLIWGALPSFFCLQLEYTARLDFLWRVQAKEEINEMKELREHNENMLRNILPSHVARHFLEKDRDNEVCAKTRSHQKWLYEWLCWFLAKKQLSRSGSGGGEKFFESFRHKYTSNWNMKNWEASSKPKPLWYQQLLNNGNQIFIG